MQPRYWLTTTALFGILWATAAVAISEKKEIELGKTMHPRVIQDFGIYPDPEIQDYVDRIGQELAAVSERAELKWHFTVLDDDAVNAFAMPGGYIYITRGMMVHLNSEAELAAILGHEIGHVTGKHASKRDTSGKLLNLASAAAAIGTGTPIASSATNMVGGALISGYSRGQELEADEYGARYMAMVGYDPEAMLKTVGLLKKRELFEIEQAKAEDREPRIGHGLYATHPDNDKRFEEAVKAAHDHAIADPRPDNVDGFLDMLDGMKWGPAATPGVIRANYFYHAKFGIKMKFPENWRVEGAKGRILAIADTNDAVMQLFVVVPGRKMTAEDALKRKLGLTKLREGKAITIGGMSAFIGLADRYVGPFGARPVRVAAILDNRARRAYIFAGSGKRDLSRIAADSDFISTIFSFDKLPREEFSLGRPPILKVVRAEEGTTMEWLAERSAVPTFAEQNIRLINDMYPGGEPEPGQLIKTVD